MDIALTKHNYLTTIHVYDLMLQPMDAMRHFFFSLCLWLFSPAMHEHIAGTWVIFQRHKLLETQLLAASIEAIRAVNASGVVIAT